MSNAQTPESTTVAPKSQARIFQEKFAAQAGDNMLRTIQRTIKRASVLTGVALGVSMPHQMLFLISKCLEYQANVWETIAMIMIAVSIPVVSDILIISCIEQISTRAMETKSRVRALVNLLVPLGVSGYVNFAGTAPLIIKGLSALLVYYIIASEVLKFAKADFRKVDQIESENLAAIAPMDEPIVTRRPRFKSAKEKVLHLLEHEPELDPKGIAKRANVSVNYVYSVRRDAAMAQASE